MNQKKEKESTKHKIDTIKSIFIHQVASILVAIFGLLVASASFIDIFKQFNSGDFEKYIYIMAPFLLVVFLTIGVVVYFREKTLLKRQVKNSVSTAYLQALENSFLNPSKDS